MTDYSKIPLSQMWLTNALHLNSTKKSHIQFQFLQKNVNEFFNATVIAWNCAS